MKKIAILQSNYIPWKGYFDLIRSVDEFIIYDSVQYTKNDWRNRNTIKTSNGLKWLTVPVKYSFSEKQSIYETIIDNNRWQIKHWKSIENNYSKAKYYDEIEKILRPLILENRYIYLSDLNSSLIKAICKFLNIKTEIKQSKDFELPFDRQERLIKICKDCNADIYVSGPAAKNYINVSKFDDNNIQLKWFEYKNYPEYKQKGEIFCHNVSIIDLLFNCGEKSIYYI